MTAKSVLTIMELLILHSKQKGRPQGLGFQPVLLPVPIASQELWEMLRSRESRNFTEKDFIMQLPRGPCARWRGRCGDAAVLGSPNSASYSSPMLLQRSPINASAYQGGHEWNPSFGLSGQTLFVSPQEK